MPQSPSPERRATDTDSTAEQPNQAADTHVVLSSHPIPMLPPTGEETVLAARSRPLEMPSSLALPASTSSLEAPSDEPPLGPDSARGSEVQPGYAFVVPFVPTAALASTGGGTVLGLDGMGDTRPAQAGTGPHVGRYPVVSLLGRGGMGEVLRVRDPDLNRDVALKRMRDTVTSPRALDAFLLEAQVTGQLAHPNIVPLYELGREVDGRRYFTLKRVEGHTLEQLLAAERAAGPAPVSRSLARDLEILIKVCDALAYAHHRGVLHRDLKPSNVMVGAFGEVLVMDWGLAKLIGSSDPDVPALEVDVEMDADGVRTFETVNGAVLGTPTYMAPEQAEGRIHDLDARTDIYALGGILYEMLTLRTPYVARTSMELLAQVRAGRLPPPRVRAPDRRIPAELEAVTLRAMALDRDARYPNVEALASDLRAFVEGGLLLAARYTLLQRLGRWARRHRGALRAVGAALLVAAGHAGWNLHVERARRAAHEDLVGRARARVDALAIDIPDVPARIAFDGPGRLRPTAEQLQRQGVELERLREVAEAYGALLALEPADEAGRAGRVRVLMAIGRLAERSEEYALAELALGQALPLASEKEVVEAELSHVRAARTARLADHAAGVRRRLAEARAGALERGVDYQAALVELAGYQERETVDLLVAELARLTARLGSATIARIASVAVPSDGERGAGGKDLAGLSEAAAAWLAAQRPTSPGLPVPATPPDALALVQQGWVRLEVRSILDRGPGAAHRDWRAVLADAQRDELEREGHDARVLALACDTLGLLGDPAGTIEPLGAYLWIEEDEVRAVAAGRALALLSVRSTRARDVLLELVGLAIPPLRAPRWQTNGAWWSQVRSALPGAADDGPAELGTAAAHHRRGQARESSGDRAGAVRDYSRAIALDSVYALAYASRGHARMTTDPAAARADLDRALELDPRLAIAVSNRGSLRRVAGDLDGALADFARAIELDSTLAVAFYNRATVLETQGKRAEALADYSRAIALDPSNAAAHNGRGLVLNELGDAVAALADFARAIELDPRQPASWCNHGVVRRARGDLDGALRDFARAIELDPRCAPAYRERGATLLERGDPAGAARDYDRAITLAPAFAEAFNGRALARYATGDRDGAIADATRAIELAPNFVEAHLNRGTALMAKGDYAGAAVDYRRATELAPTRAVAHHRLGTALRLAEDVEGAIRSYTRALELEPLSAEVHNAMGQALDLKEDYAGAVASYARATELDPRSPAAWRNLCAARRQAKDLDGAIAAGARAIELEPRDARNYNLRGLAYRAKGELDLAIEDCDRAIELDARFAPAYRTRARALESKGELGRALTDAERALELAPQHSPSWEVVGQVLAAMGRRPEAIEKLRRALELAPATAKPRLEARIAELEKDE